MWRGGWAGCGGGCFGAQPHSHTRPTPPARMIHSLPHNTHHCRPIRPERRSCPRGRRSPGRSWARGGLQAPAPPRSRWRGDKRAGRSGGLPTGDCRRQDEERWEEGPPLTGRRLGGVFPSHISRRGGLQTPPSPPPPPPSHQISFFPVTPLRTPPPPSKGLTTTPHGLSRSLSPPRTDSKDPCRHPTRSHPKGLCTTPRSLQVVSTTPHGRSTTHTPLRSPPTPRYGASRRAVFPTDLRLGGASWDKGSPLLASSPPNA